jgi:choline kinase
MVKALILSAGQGRRLRPLTATKPKCLVSIGDKAILEWQLETLEAAGVARATVVVGFRAEKVEQTLAARAHSAIDTSTIFNPRYDTADNLISCWVARDEMNEDFLLVNGDTLFESDVVHRLLASPPAPVTLAVGYKPEYDDDDMKVSCDGHMLRRVGKDLPASETSGESIGLLLFRGEGPRLFREALARATAQPEAGRLWYLSAVNDLAMRGMVQIASVEGLQWAEVDYWNDLDDAQKLVESWTRYDRTAMGSMRLLANAK